MHESFMNVCMKVCAQLIVVMNGCIFLYRYFFINVGALYVDTCKFVYMRLFTLLYLYIQYR